MTDNTFTRVDLAQFDGHTPGPWREHDADVTMNGHRIKLRYEAPSDNKLMPIGDFTRTLHLIAAAPRLLAALRAAYAEIDRLQSQVIAVQEDAMTIYGDNDRLTAEIDRLRAELNDAWMESGHDKATIDRLRASALTWTTVTDDPATLPEEFRTCLVHVIQNHRSIDNPRTAYRVNRLHGKRWVLAANIGNSRIVRPGDRWAYIPEAQA